MMDSENKALEVGKTVFPTYATKREVLERVREIAHGEADPDKDEVDYLKTVFYKMHIAEREASDKE